MIDPKVLLLCAALYGGYLGVHKAVDGVKWIAHHTKPAIYHVLHPHEKK